MTSYLLSYRIPKDYRPSRDPMEAWDSWFRSLSGSELIDRGNPVMSRQAIGNVPHNSELGGYSLIEADSFEEAAAIAAGCPFLADGGGVEIGALTIINQGTELA